MAKAEFGAVGPFQNDPRLPMSADTDTEGWGAVVEVDAFGEGPYGHIGEVFLHGLARFSLVVQGEAAVCVVYVDIG